jgi:hypothetical protein
MLSREDIEVHLHPLETVIEQFQLSELGHSLLGNCIAVWI